MRLSALACCSSPAPLRADAAAPPVAAPAITPAGRLGPGRRLHHRRPGRAGLSLLVSRRAVARGAGQGVQRLSRSARRSAGSCRPGSCCAPRRRGRSAAASRSKCRRPSEWPHIVQTLRYIRDYVIPAVGPVEPVSVYRNPIAQPMRRRSAGKRAQALFGDRHGAAAADHPRGADADAVRRSIREHGAAYKPASASTPSCASTSTAPSSGAGTWTRRSPPNARRSSIRSDAASVGQPLPPPAPVQRTGPSVRRHDRRSASSTPQRVHHQSH